MAKKFKINLSGKFKDLKGNPIKEWDREVEKTVELDEINILLGNLLYVLKPEDKNKMLCAEMAEKVFKNKSLELTEGERKYLYKLIKQLDFTSGLHTELGNRIFKEK